jgi:hypothetical protein
MRIIEANSRFTDPTPAPASHFEASRVGRSCRARGGTLLRCGSCGSLVPVEDATPSKQFPQLIGTCSKCEADHRQGTLELTEAKR